MKRFRILLIDIICYLCYILVFIIGLTIISEVECSESLIIQKESCFIIKSNQLE